MSWSEEGCLHEHGVALGLFSLVPACASYYGEHNIVTIFDKPSGDIFSKVRSVVCGLCALATTPYSL